MHKCSYVQFVKQACIQRHINNLPAPIRKNMENNNCTTKNNVALPNITDDEEILMDLADLFKIFADTTRIKILYALMEQALCVAEISEAVSVSQSAVSHQLRILKNARLVKYQRDGKNIIYSISDDHVISILNQGLTHICE